MFELNIKSLAEKLKISFQISFFAYWISRRCFGINLLKWRQTAQPPVNISEQRISICFFQCKQVKANIVVNRQYIYSSKQF